MTLADSLSTRDNAAIARDTLARSKSLIEPALDALTHRLSPELRPVVLHHLSGGGKLVRATLALLSAVAGGADEQTGLVGALAIELVHNFSLIHDDIIDGDVERRHVPTVWAKFGVGPALIAGDALLTLAFQILLEEPSNERVKAARLLSDTTQGMIVGQGEDINSEHQLFLSVEDCVSMEAGKTGALLACAASIGAVLAGADDQAVAALFDFGQHLGLAFQAVDDILGVWGDPHVTGKPVGNDLRMRKKTLPISIANAKGFEVFTEPFDRELTDAEVAEAMVLLEECGAKYETMEMAESNLQAALASLDRVPLVPTAVSELAAIAYYVIERDK
ncbi:MAG: polyprenyl synthetase family protein [Acidimicrobiales bacterium]